MDKVKFILRDVFAAWDSWFTNIWILEVGEKHLWQKLRLLKYFVMEVKNDLEIG